MNSIKSAVLGIVFCAGLCVQAALASDTPCATPPLEAGVYIGAGLNSNQCALVVSASCTGSELFLYPVGNPTDPGMPCGATDLKFHFLKAADGTFNSVTSEDGTTISNVPLSVETSRSFQWAQSTWVLYGN